jgi:hypothetical protein
LITSGTYNFVMNRDWQIYSTVICEFFHYCERVS